MVGLTSELEIGIDRCLRGELVKRTPIYNSFCSDFLSGKYSVCFTSTIDFIAAAIYGVPPKKPFYDKSIVITSDVAHEIP